MNLHHFEVDIVLNSVIIIVVLEGPNRLSGPSWTTNFS